MFKDWLPICRALYSYSGVREYVFQRFQQFGGGGYQSGVGAAHVDARDEVARVEGTIGFRHKCSSLALDYGITSDWANTPRSRRVLVHFAPPSLERQAMLGASLRSTHTYWPSTMIWVIFGFVGFICFLLFTATTTPSREGAGISVNPFELRDHPFLVWLVF